MFLGAVLMDYQKLPILFRMNFLLQICMLMVFQGTLIFFYSYLKKRKQNVRINNTVFFKSYSQGYLKDLY